MHQMLQIDTSNGSLSNSSSTRLLAAVMRQSHNQPRSTSLQNTSVNYPDQNKICQWYCCECGKAFGQIYYKQHFLDDEQSDTNLIDRLKYYSNIVYTESENSGDFRLRENEDYFQVLLIPSSGHSSPAPNAAKVAVQKNFSVSSAHKRVSVAEELLLLLLVLLVPHVEHDDGYLHDQTLAAVVLKIPTRFTCHRCDHMMCPYCPKVRFKDLNNENV